MSAWADLSQLPRLEPRAWRSSAVAAFAAHALLLLIAGRALFTPVSYGVEKGFGGIDVQLVAAPRESAPAAAPAPEPALSDPQTVEIALPRPAPAAPDASGDGSSPVPGRDVTTLSSGGGARSARPHTLSNPAPAYPEAARRARQEGLVLLEVAVSSEGRAARVDVRDSSGYPILDRAAREAVRDWRFQPARFGAVAVESVVEVPVRFRLEDA